MVCSIMIMFESRTQGNLRVIVIVICAIDLDMTLRVSYLVCVHQGIYPWTCIALLLSLARQKVWRACVLVHTGVLCAEVKKGGALCEVRGAYRIKGSRSCQLCRRRAH
jgi:hypothetical protein